MTRGGRLRAQRYATCERGRLPVARTRWPFVPNIREAPVNITVEQLDRS